MNLINFNMDIDMIDENRFYGKSYTEMCKTLDMMDMILEDRTLYLEAMSNGNINTPRAFSNQLDRSAYAAREMARAHGKLTDVGGNVMFTAWELCVRAVSAAATMVKFVWDKILSTPTLIAKIKEKVVKIPNAIIADIRGDIKLYLTAKDVESFYSDAIFPRLIRYLDLASKIADGDFWGCYGYGINWKPGQFELKFSKKRVNSKGKRVNDVQICEQLIKVAKELDNIQFVQAVVPLNKEENQKIYFGNAQSVNFKDLQENEFHGTYYDGLIKIFNDLKASENDMKAISKLLDGKKLDASKQFQELAPRYREIILEMFRSTSKVISTIGKIIKCVLSDIKEISTAVNDINSKVHDTADDDTKNAVGSNPPPISAP